MNITVIAMGTVVPMSKVEGSWIWFYGYIQYIYSYHDNLHVHAHYWHVQRLLPVSEHGEFIRHGMKVVSSLVVRSQDFRDE